MAENPNLRQGAREGPPVIAPNELFKFASYNYIFTISALNQEEITNQLTLLNSRPHDIIARSGGVGADAPISENFYSNGANE